MGFLMFYLLSQEHGRMFSLQWLEMCKKPVSTLLPDVTASSLRGQEGRLVSWLCQCKSGECHLFLLDLSK